MARGSTRGESWKVRCRTLAPGVLYLLLGAPFAWNYRHHFTSDSAVYMDMARLLAEGRFPEAFVGYWGPLFPALTALLLKAGIPILAAAHLVGYLSGLAWVLCLQWFLRRTLRAPLADLGAVVGGIPAALVVGVPYSVLPDALLSMAVMALCAVLMADARRPGWRGPLLAGAACGFAYLCKTPAWILLAVPAAASLLWARREAFRREGAGPALRKSALALLLLPAGFLPVAGPWIAGVSLRTGEPSLGSGTKVLLVSNYIRDGLPAPGLRFRIPYDGERWLQHNPWSREPDGPVPFHWGFHLGRIAPNMVPFLKFALACPLILLGALLVLLRPQRILRDPRLHPAAMIVAWGIPPLLLRYLEIRFLLYFSPLLLQLALALPLPKPFPSLGLRKRRVILVATIVAFAYTVRYIPTRPLGMARMQGAEVVHGRLHGDERIGYNNKTAGLPVAFLLDRPLALQTVPTGGPRNERSPDIVVWSEIPSDPKTRLPPGGLPGYAPLHDWFEEDGLHVRVFRATR